MTNVSQQNVSRNMIARDEETMRVRSLAMHNFNTKTVKKKKFIYFFFEKLNIFMCKNVNHYFLPYLLVKKTFNPNSIQNKLNLNFLDFKKILIFNEEYKDYLSNF